MLLRICRFFNCTPTEALAQDANLVFAMMEGQAAETARQVMTSPGQIGDAPPDPHYGAIWLQLNNLLDEYWGEDDE